MAEGAAAAKEARAQPSSVTANGATLQQVTIHSNTSTWTFAIASTYKVQGCRTSLEIETLCLIGC
jgi:hypothetical protein